MPTRPNSGPRLAKIEYERSQYRGAARRRAKRKSWFPASDLARDQIERVRAARHSAKSPCDPLATPLAARIWDRCAAAREVVAAQARAEEATRRELRRQHARATRATLIRAARTARDLGFLVRASRDRAGRISSYYVEASPLAADKFPHRVRISDHEIPWTQDRAGRAELSGANYDGYRGAQILFDRPRPTYWLRRAIILAAAGRAVPGAPESI